jgi:Protein of unknown function (DUF3810)
MWKKKQAWILLIALAALIKLLSFFPGVVEKYYSNGLYPIISKTQRILFGWLPFSIGDIFYILAGAWLLFKLINCIVRIIKRRTSKQYWLNTLWRTLFAVLLLYIIFNLFWGLNYNRKGIAYQLGLKVTNYDKKDLEEVMQQIVFRLNELDSAALINRPQLQSNRHLFVGADSAYTAVATAIPELAYDYKSVKSSLFGTIGNYLGYTGYYNPFSGEAQVNTTVPLFIRPFTTCHEIGHQLGYAKENEANFVGYLSARYSLNPAFRYSVYFDLYSYSFFYLYIMDSAQAIKFNKELLPGIRKDYRALQEFIYSFRNPAEKVIDKLYGQYLKANEQPAGKFTYNEVISWLIAYYKRFGPTAI